MADLMMHKNWQQGYQTVRAGIQPDDLFYLQVPCISFLKSGKPCDSERKCWRAQHLLHCFGTVDRGMRVVRIEFSDLRWSNRYDYFASK